MAVTIQKIAELSGVSRGTVDRVLHGRPNVNPMIREKVVRAAEKLGYQSPVPPKSADCRQAAILIPQWTDGHFNRQIVSGIRKALRYIADPAFILTEQPLRTMTMQELLRAMDEQIRSGVDGLIIRAENTPEVRAAIEQAVQKGVTVITYDADVPHSGRLCHAGQDLVRAGAIAAGVMARLIRSPEHVLIVTGNLRMEAHKGRVDGFCRRLLELGFSEDAYRVIETNEMPELTGELVAQALQADSRLHAVYMACQPLSSCIAGIRKARRTTRPHIVCNDLTPTAKRYLREGTVDFVIGQSFSQESFHAVLAMYQMLLRGVQPKRELYYTDLRLITQEML
ncbi:transcriptional regulator [Butyricicoccus faecihominis]|uniref:Transcriptional regulator n=2 Tax=Butyricicoccus TaxID=580596 RepID=A0ABQ1E115_9FIRM|nr:LacI family DNA-binding transcriptional regulator [Butyricicoccus faecihominis]GFO88615.1 transcriptional regulator [Butyricicoccus faecihominis]GGM60891.1 transcriptional regulator [Butyricicoccus faecihominis]